MCRFAVRECFTVAAIRLAARQYCVFKVFRHFGYVCHAALCKLLELLIVNIGAVHSHYIASGQCCRLEDGRIVCRSRCKLYVGGNAFVGVYDCMYLDAPFLLSCLWMPSDTLEKQI